MILTFFGILFYILFSLIVNDVGLIGTFGLALSETLTRLFGFAAFIAPIAGGYLLATYYRVGFISKHLISLCLGFALLLLSLMILQSSLIPHDHLDLFGLALTSTLYPVVGQGGVILIALCLALFGTVLAWEDRLRVFIQHLKTRLSKPKLSKVEEPLSQSDDQEPSQTVDDEPWLTLEQESTPMPHITADKRQDMHHALNELQSFVSTTRQNTKKLKKSTPELLVEAESLPTKPTVEVSTSNEPTTVVKELEENKKLLDDLEFGELKKPQNFLLPKIDFLTRPPQKKGEVNEAEIDEKIKELLEKFTRFKIEGDVVRTYTGPVVTTFEFKPAPHVKVSRISTLQDDIAMALRAQTIRILAPIPGKDVVGIEIPNRNSETIYLRQILESELFAKSASPLTLALGKDIVGNPFVTDLKKLPHLLIAGTTGSGKSVGINAMILSLLYKNSPDQLRLLLIDPKMLEFSIYNDIPHLLTPVITKPKQAIAALANMVKEMERRYYLMSKTKTKNIDNYNEKALKEGYETMPFIVIIIDELADLMMTSGKDVEISIARLAQMARAAGIHLIVATQRPSVDVVTGLIKANLPSRISYRVGQKIDSKVILDQLGAESLLGRGDMLFTPPGSVGVVRLHAPWNTEAEIEKIVDFLKDQRPPNYDNSFLCDEDSLLGGTRDDVTDDLDELYEEAKNIVLSEKKTSISYIQRRLQIGYNRAARIVEQLEATGILSEQNSKGQREIL